MIDLDYWPIGFQFPEHKPIIFRNVTTWAGATSVLLNVPSGFLFGFYFGYGAVKHTMTQKRIKKVSFLFQKLNI